VNVRLLSNVAETPTTRRIRVGLNGAPFVYRAGQAAALATGGEPTPYSIASAPGETRRHGWLEFLVKVDGSSRFGAVAETLAEGASIDLNGPAGEFTLERASHDAPLLFVAGGTGIAPMRAMVRDAVDAGRRHVALVYSNRTPDEFAYLDELTQLASTGCLKLSLTLTGDAQDWTHARGRTGVSHLAELVLPGTVAFICGPPAMLTDVPAALQALGVTPDRIVTESW
jgi:phenol hydroxylase P5 protein